ncbi:MAG: 30S ribosomal protein S13 [Candidatus Uhrbacteria bacterium GW2011_GWF2_39_13]|uniref:Small ribosomal subunit protein uS13 n=1 Tax=Candidatus Uhrbacteria bacterium GW2011_GWF2_39_13 TaxID=1618995 RepID=A0A0G0MP42_9BACT|nr:MAG: 30S ribosomal protein S13 [Candidatus Uhrbacteria bacterium GW2011_GWF2_39_13]HAU66102.1 30S ribosomal protein S13 [Candidatus Uhrbacteria bacterium]
MARIAGVTIPSDKRIVIALTYIYGVGITTSKKILSQVQVDENIRTKDLNDDQVNNIRILLEKNYRLEGDLRRDKISNIKRLKEINSYRGTRHAKNLPARGQRTKSNSRTVRGNVRRTTGSGRRTLTKT